MASYGDVLQLVVLELIRKVVRANPLDKSKYIRCILTLFNSQSNAVVYECAPHTTRPSGPAPQIDATLPHAARSDTGLGRPQWLGAPTLAWGAHLAWGAPHWPPLNVA